MEKTKLSFEVDASQIDIKPILKKDFLELSMKAISSANPNRNNSWFTEESMERSKGTFVNKPILGYFENDDFVSHNGDWKHDSETEMDYWDTLGKKGERILGVIRESDEVRIVKDRKGLSWITFTCMLWTQYSFKQVKRLIKDAKRAAKSGSAAKNISVEVDITDYEILPNGVMKINAFNLVGVTILGSRNGVKVEPGIEDAELSVVDVMGRDVYEKQQRALRLAYERLDGAEISKEEPEMELEKEDIEETIESSEGEAEEQRAQILEDREKFEEGGACEICGKNPCECEKAQEEREPEPEPEHESAGECGECMEGKAPEEPKEEEQECLEKADCAEEIPPEEKPAEPAGEPEPEGDPEDKGDDDDHDDDEPEEKGDEVREDDCLEPAKTEWELRYEEKSEELEALKAKYSELEGRYAELLAESERKADYEELRSKVVSYEHKEFMDRAGAMLRAATDSGKIEEEAVKGFMEKCEGGEISDLEDLKVKVAVAAFDRTVKVEEADALAMPANKPDVTVAFAGKAEKNSKSSDCWSSLREYSKR